jgi:hypothetical protein
LAIICFWRVFVLVSILASRSSIICSVSIFIGQRCSYTIQSSVL